MLENKSKQIAMSLLHGDHIAVLTQFGNLLVAMLGSQEEGVP
jgi:hypothetical protein